MSYVNQGRALTVSPAEESVVPSTVRPNKDLESPVGDGTVVKVGKDIVPPIPTY
jgi:hypothetical protein